MRGATHAWALLGMVIGWALGFGAALWVIAHVGIEPIGATVLTGAACCVGLAVGQVLGGLYGIRRNYRRTA